MEDYKEFTGKTLDEAMAAACNYFGLERGKLEIEILSDAKSGIFGLVGAKKATVRARKASLEALNLKVGAEKNGDKKQKAQSPKPQREKEAKAASERGEPRAKAKPQADAPRAEKAAAPKAAAPKVAVQDAPAPEEKSQRPAPKQAKRDEAPAESNGERPQNGRNRSKSQAGGRPEGRPDRNQRRERVRQPRTDKPAPAPEGMEEKFPEVPLENMDLAKLEAEVLGAVEAMTKHIVGETEKEFEVSGGKARVRINSGEDSGLLIGRDGQTLSALQYLASCIVSRRMQASVRVQIDAGDYRSRQLDKLRAIAIELAEKVKENSRPQSTRPMSAYLRRVVHMALADDPDVQTHSKGDGSLKRVVIVPKKK